MELKTDKENGNDLSYRRKRPVLAVIVGESEDVEAGPN